MIKDLQSRIIACNNELKAQKVAQELAYSSILWPDNTPTEIWTGSVALQLSGSIVARFLVRFRRTDGVSGAPFVDFAQIVKFTPTYKAYTQSLGWTVTGNDLSYVDDQNYTGYFVGTGADYVDYYIDFTRDLIANYYTLNSINIEIEVQAIAMVQGNLTITRLV